MAAPCLSDGAGGVDNAGGACEVSGTTGRITADNGPGNPITASDVTVTVPFGTAVSALNGSSVIFGPNALVRDIGGGGFVGLLADGAGSVIDASSHGLRIILPGAADAVRATNGGQVFLGEGTVIDITPSGGSRVLHAIGADSLITATGATFLGTTWGGDRIAHAENGGQIQISNSDITLATGGGGVSSVEASGAGSVLLMNNVNIDATGAGGNAVGMLATNGAFMSLTGGSVDVVGGGGSTALRASGLGTQISVANPAISLMADNSAAMDIQDGATISVSGGSVTATGTNSVGMRISGGGANTNRLLMQNTQLRSTSDSFRVEGGSIADITIRNMNVLNNNGNLLSVDGDVEFTTSSVTMSGRILTLGGSNYVDLGNNTVWGVTANSNMTGLENTSSTIMFAGPSGAGHLAICEFRCA